MTVRISSSGNRKPPDRSDSEPIRATSGDGRADEADGLATTHVSPVDLRKSALDQQGESDLGHSPTEASQPARGEASTGVRFRAIGPGSRLGRYQVVDELGTGGMATVYRARDTELRREVAIKVLFPHLSKRHEVVARFQREARAVAALDHPHILRVHDVGGGPGAAESSRSGAEQPDDPLVEVDPPYIVLELVRGTSLRELALTHCPMVGEVVAAIGAVMCSALEVAHRAGIIHRDIKPANIMVAEGGRLVLADFGVARIEDEDSSLVTRTGALLGTPAFMSPEQAHGEDLDERSDLYSLGATLYQLATGSMPFSGPTPKMIWAITRGERTPVLRRNPRLGPDLAAAIDRMMALEPDQRYPDAGAARRALLEVLAVAELRDEEAVLTEFFAAPGDYEAAHAEALVAATLAAARAAAADRSVPRALALADRVLAFEPDNREAMALVESVGQGGSRRWLVGGALAAAVAIAALGWWWQAGRHPALSVDPDAGIVDAGPEDAGLDATGAVADAGPIDARAPAPPPDARRTIRRRPVDAAVAVVVTPPDAAVVVRAPPIDAAPAPATLTLKMNAWCDLTIDGVAHGRANRNRPIEVSPGRHRVVCSQGPGLGEWSQSVRVAAGEHRVLEGDLLRPVEITVAVTGGDAVRVGGAVHDNGAELRLQPGRYRIDVMAKGSRVGGGWVAIPRVAACTLRDRPELDCY